MSSAEPPTVTGGLGWGVTEPHAAEGGLGAAEGDQVAGRQVRKSRRFTAVCYLPCGASDVRPFRPIPPPELVAALVRLVVRKAVLLKLPLHFHFHLPRDLLCVCMCLGICLNMDL